MEIIQQYLIKTDDYFVVEQEKNIVTVFFGAQEMMVIDLKDKKEVKDAVIYFKKINVSTHKVSQILKICRETVDAWFKIYEEFDREALYNIKMGPKKVTPEIEAYIIAKTKDLEFCGGYRKIIKEGIQKHFNKEISVGTISYTLKKNKIDTSIKKYNKILKTKKNTTISSDLWKLEKLS